MISWTFDGFIGLVIFLKCKALKALFRMAKINHNETRPDYRCKASFIRTFDLQAIC